MKATETVNPSIAQPKRARIRRMRWYNEALSHPDSIIPAGTVMDLLSDTQDIARGISVVMDILNFQSLADQDLDEPELFVDIGDRETLMRFVGATADLLADRLDRTTSWAYEYHTPEGRAEALRRARYVSEAAGRG